MESGEYFLSKEKKLAKKWQEKQENQIERAAENKRKREAAFVPPVVWDAQSDRILVVENLGGTCNI